MEGFKKLWNAKLPAQKLNKPQNKNFPYSLWKTRSEGSQGILKSLQSFSSILVQDKKWHLIGFLYNYIPQVTYSLSTAWLQESWVKGEVVTNLPLCSACLNGIFATDSPQRTITETNLCLPFYSRAINCFSQIFWLRKHIWCWAVPPHPLFFNSDTALPHAVLKHCSALWILVCLGTFFLHINWQLQIPWLVCFLNSTQKFLHQKMSFVGNCYWMFGHEGHDREITGINESFSPDLDKPWNYTKEKKSYLVVFLISIETGDYKYPPWRGF